MAPVLDEIQTPALLVRLDRVRANLDELRRRAGGTERLRPHLKTSKIPEVWALLLASGLRHFKCATTREAGVLLALADELGATVDLLVAFPHRGPNLARLGALRTAHRGPLLATLAEDPAQAAAAAALGLGVFVDLDPGWGRSGIPLEQTERAAATARAAGASLRGWHCYEGDVRDLEPARRRARCFAIYERLLERVAALEHGLAVAPAQDLELVTSGTPTFDAALAWPGFRDRFHRVGPGTILFHDLTSAELGLSGFEFAASVLATVVSAPSAHRRTLDAGSKAVDAACGTPCCAVAGWPGLAPQEPSEEHLPLLVQSGPAPAPGARLELLPRHVCPTVNLHERAVLLEGEEVVAVVPVAARGHDSPGSAA